MRICALSPCMPTCTHVQRNNDTTSYTFYNIHAYSKAAQKHNEQAPLSNTNQ